MEIEAYRLRADGTEINLDGEWLRVREATMGVHDLHGPVIEVRAGNWRVLCPIDQPIPVRRDS